MCLLGLADQHFAMTGQEHRAVLADEGGSEYERAREVQPPEPTVQISPARSTRRALPVQPEGPMVAQHRDRRTTV